MRTFNHTSLLKRLEAIEKRKGFNSVLVSYDGVITSQGRFEGMRAEDIPPQYKVIHIVFTDA